MPKKYIVFSSPVACCFCAVRVNRLNLFAQSIGKLLDLHLMTLISMLAMTLSFLVVDAGGIEATAVTVTRLTNPINAEQVL